MKLIAFSYEDYEAEGGMSDVIGDETEEYGYKVFESEEEIIEYVQKHPVDNIQIVSLVTLRIISEYSYIRDADNCLKGHYEKIKAEVE